MDIRTILNKVEWNTFFETIGSPSFHHSWEWGEFQILCKKEILRLGLYKGSTLVAIALVVKVKSKRGSYLFVPHGPLFAIHQDKLTQKIPAQQFTEIRTQLAHIHSHLVTIARREGFWFIRIAPPMTRDEDHANLFHALGYKTAPIYVHAETMWVIDVTKSENEILMDMRKNTRYAIRRGEREQISVSLNATTQDIDRFLSLYHMTADREQFTPYSDDYIKHEIQAFQSAYNVAIFNSGFQDSPKNSIPQEFAQEGTSRNLAAAIVIFSKSAGFYHQGASIHSKYPAAYLLQWHAILEAKRRNCTYYSFHGIHDPGRTPRSWDGLSLFKRGFGGFQVDYLYTQDFIISPFYVLSYLGDRYLSWRRGI
ncbi:hypothetical protein CO051_05760 [Candidatus Roizmanbacteria bacterium CG_4_9_14_0_2_um_filter_39_13]|uniref:Methicillin resistance protein n=2 Tax=Candidatus Roizmaniibacteriota TaxID=1752723 RepID=A0A2M8EX40_9BACT|nr:MAG: hypothetical protein COY15_04765 [Candidatus Roizmanbacteria bacterium CG_4_10_14_0_2_um_filter_39_12]PJC30430.1 MAG: hypothetical protein CO051_05760 [Candidatus Roizmanbacteria bacterium CG_4_9_14_0_2_um_filter_39_13]PJE61651.1 MAG: hypothetical protein COU87_03375 [Candidatus Roizmanbacteria bacterium CG10_big_fil_rev_8_21_14_0_10_39_12]